MNDPARSRPSVAVPPLSLRLLELGMVGEMWALLAASPALSNLARGDGHPVLVITGFGADDTSTLPLRAFVHRWGYPVYGAHGASRLGPTREVVAATRRRLADIHERHGRKVSVVGWSLGGLYARALARWRPELVRQVITLACPLQMTFDDRNVASPIIDRLRFRFDPEFQRTPDHEQGLLPVCSTSIYTRTDGVARWYTCLDVVDEQHENVEVYGTHTGHGFNPFAFAVVANRLGQPEGDWQPFRPPAHLRLAYPRPSAHRPRISR